MTVPTSRTIDNTKDVGRKIPAAALDETEVLDLVNPEVVDLDDLKQQVAIGNTANTDIALAGATLAGTTIVSVLEYDPNGGGGGKGTWVERTSEAVMTSDGNMQLNTTDTTGHDLVVLSITKA